MRGCQVCFTNVLEEIKGGCLSFKIIFTLLIIKITFIQGSNNKTP